MVVKRLKEDELTHFGIEGMKWGVRRYQNADGSLTAEGKARLKSFKSTETADIKSKLKDKTTKYNEKIKSTDDAEKKETYKNKIEKAKTQAKAEIEVVKNYTLKDISKEKLVVGAEVTLKTVAAIGTFTIPLVPDVAGVALIASTRGAKQRYRLSKT